MNQYKIAVAGTGYVGMSIATLLAQHHQVTAVDVIIEDKLNYMFEIARMLGVTSIEAKALFLEEKRMEIAIDGGLTYKYVGTNLEINETERQAYAKRYERKEKFSGEFSTESYRKACAKAQQYGLLVDSGIQYLLKQRNPDEPNPILQQSVKIENDERVE